jgi:hypothetical protein
MLLGQGFVLEIGNRREKGAAEGTDLFVRQVGEGEDKREREEGGGRREEGGRTN